MDESEFKASLGYMMPYFKILKKAQILKRTKQNTIFLVCKVGGVY